jgi:uncharacterized iron-regulated membrane protein
MIRRICVLAHRWVGLTIAAFLCVSGLTGAVISWDHELDELLNSHLTHVDSRGPNLSSLALVEAIEAADPRVVVTYAPLTAEEGKALVFGVAANQDSSTGRLYEIGYNEVFVDPVTGSELGRREWGAAWPVTAENLVSFLYVLHYSLHIPELWGTDRWGLWLLGAVAIFWTLDCFVGFYLTLPARRRAARDDVAGDAPVAGRSWRQRWAPAWKVRWLAGSTKLNFDLHRAFSLWTWALLFIIAFTAFSLNLYTEVFYPLMSKVSAVTPSPYDVRTPVDHDAPIKPVVTYSALLETATAEAQRRGWGEPAGTVYYSPEYGIHGVEFFFAGADHGSGGVGHKTLFYDGVDGRYLGDSQPWRGTAADLFVQAQFPVHSGRILGLPGRILISLMGLVVAVLSVTGVVIWAKKRAARVNAEARGGARARDRAPPRTRCAESESIW